MARYREKDQTDLAWNRTRREITRTLDTKLMNFREELLNDLLSTAWTKYVAALDAGEIVELEDEAAAWVDAQLEKHLRPQLGTPDGDLAHS